jgi:hypothetical protein
MGWQEVVAGADADQSRKLAQQRVLCLGERMHRSRNLPAHHAAVPVKNTPLPPVEETTPGVGRKRAVHRAVEQIVGAFQWTPIRAAGAPPLTSPAALPSVKDARRGPSGKLGGGTIMDAVDAFVLERCGKRRRVSSRSDADSGSGAESADHRPAATGRLAITLPWGP